MPTSNPYQINDILELIILTSPKSLLDIGVGFGKYGFLAREYLELYDGREKYGDWQRRIDGIEAFGNYITPLQRQIYSNIFSGNASDIVPELKNNYDLILMIDVLEHFSLEEGTKLLKECLKHGRNLAVSTPWDIGVQGDHFGNPYETHRFQWEKKHFDAFPKKFFVHNDRSLICYIGEDAPRIGHSKRSRLKTALKILFPFLRRP